MVENDQKNTPKKSCNYGHDGPILLMSSMEIWKNIQKKSIANIFCCRSETLALI